VSSVFDINAKLFAADIDKAIESGCYRRGDLFVQFANRTIPPGSLILDYGCGPGRISLMLARSGFQVLGVDPSQRMIDQAKEQDTHGLRIQFRVGDESVLRPSSYDAIVCSSVIEYVREPDKLLHVFRESLRGAGVLIITYNNSRSPCRLYDRFIGRRSSFADAYQQGWDWRSFRKLLTRNAFGCIVGPKFFEFHWRIDRFVGWLPLGILGIVVATKRNAP
jgi:2-polyprenyl-3-methyl-5-hydroxy-6-metoxy-1,4-benzoquinol methylase